MLRQKPPPPLRPPLDSDAGAARRDIFTEAGNGYRARRDVLVQSRPPQSPLWVLYQQHEHGVRSWHRRNQAIVYAVCTSAVVLCVACIQGIVGVWVSQWLQTTSMSWGFQVIIVAMLVAIVAIWTLLQHHCRSTSERTATRSSWASRNNNNSSSSSSSPRRDAQSLSIDMDPDLA